MYMEFLVPSGVHVIMYKRKGVLTTQIEKGHLWHLKELALEGAQAMI